MHIQPQPFFLSSPSAALSPSLPSQAETPSVYGHLPEVSASVFSDNPRAAYLVAVTAVGSSVLRPEDHEAVRALRYNKYAELGWIDGAKFDISSKGLPMEQNDSHDATSYQLAVIKNMGDKPAVVIAGARSIVKESEDRPLPVEHAFPEVFADSSAPLGSNEVSRLISDSPNKPERAFASMALQRAITNLCARGGHGPTYAMIEGYLVRRLSETHFPHDIVTPFKPIPEYNDTSNALMQTDWRKVVAGTGMFRLGVPYTTKLFFRGVEKPGVGLGYYGKHFLKHYGAVQLETE